MKDYYKIIEEVLRNLILDPVSIYYTIWPRIYEQEIGTWRIVIQFSFILKLYRYVCHATIVLLKMKQNAVTKFLTLIYLYVGIRHSGVIVYISKYLYGKYIANDDIAI